MKRTLTASLVLLLVLSSFTVVSAPAAAALPRPVADAGPDQTVGEGEEVTLDGSGSYDLTPDETLRYWWDFDDNNGTNDVDARGVEVATSYADAGVYTVTLTVSDGDYEDTDTCRITVIPGSPDNTRPVAIITAPLPGVYNRSEPIDFEGTGFDADNDPLTGEWDFGDGTKSNQPTTTHSYSDEGVVTIRWTVRDGHANDTARVVIYIGESPSPEQNRRPNAVIDVDDTSIYVDEVVTFTGENSTDPDEGDEENLEFEWDFNLDDGLDTDSTNMTQLWSWEDPGQYTVTLQVRDGKQGGWDIDRVEMTVMQRENNPPNANAGNDAEVQVGVPLSFRGTATDPDGDEIVLYQWDFGDGDEWESDTSGQTNHTYTTAGTYTAEFTAWDEQGDYDFDYRRITVNPPPDLPPVADAGEDVYAEQGKKVTLSGSGDDDFDIALYEWDFNNDGVWDWSDPDSGRATTTYEDYGTYTAILRVTDRPRPGAPGPGQTDEDSVLVFVKENEAPTASIKVSSVFWQTGQVVQFNSESSDPENARLTYAWDLDGDGVTDSTAEKPTWTYRREGSYTVTLTVKDDFGHTDTDQLTLEVTQTYEVELEISSESERLDPGESHEFRATVTNAGNGDDQFRISLGGKNNKWATADRTLINLNASERQTVTITVMVPSSALSTDDARISVSATSNYGVASAAVEIEVKVRQHFGLTATITQTSVTIVPGESREDITRVTISNTGNGPDSFRITFSGDVGAYLRTNTPKVDLAPGETREVQVSIDVPLSNPSGTISGFIVVSSTKSAEQESMDFDIVVEGTENGGGGFMEQLGGTLLYLFIAVIVIAVIVGLAASMQRRRRPGNNKKVVKA